MERAYIQQRLTKADSNQKTRRNVANAAERRTAIGKGPSQAPSRRFISASNGPLDHLLHLQGMVGNYAVGRLIQAKLAISQPGDPYEREADRVADTVMRMTEPAPPEEEEAPVQMKLLTPQITPLVQRESAQLPEEEEEKVVATSPLVQRVPVAVREEDEEEKVTPRLEAGASLQKEEKPVQAKLETDVTMQRQTKQDEERVSASSSRGAVQRFCAECAGEQQQEEGKLTEVAQRKPARYQLHDDHDEDEQRLQPKGGDAVTSPVQSSVAANIRNVTHGGSPLPQATRAFFESRFGADFSQVRVHTDSRAAETANSIQARAFTVGRNIAFGTGRYAPHSHAGRQLLAHELVHVVQQNGSQMQRAPSPAAGHAPQVATSLEPDAETKGGSERPDQSFRSSLVPSVQLAKRGLGEGEVVSQRPDNRGNSRKVRSNFLSTQPAHNPLWAQRALGIHPRGELRIARAPDDEADAGTPDARPAPVPTTPAPESTTTPAPEATSTPAPAPAPTATPGGHTVAPPGVAACPDAPPRTIVVVGCITAPSATPPAKETAVLPTPSPGRFGGDAARATFAKELAQCRAARTVKDEIDKRYRTDIAAAKKKATNESKADTEAAVKAAVEGLDPKDKSAIAKAKTKAAADAKKAAAKKIADAEAAVTRQDIATVTAELATKFEDELAADYDKTITGGIARYGASWRNTMQARLDSARKRITKEKSAKPKVAKGETPPPAKTADEIAAAVEAEMVPVRCEQTQWALDRLESLKHGWAVGRREEVDFDTLGGSAKYLKDFKPTYEVPEADRVDIPTEIQSEKGMPGVAPELASFLTQLAADPATPAFTAGNYKGHGGGAWSGKGFSADLSLKADLDQRGFWPVPLAVQFLLALDATAKALGARWRVLYNDFRVADQVNKATGMRNVGFMGDSNAPTLNWHGPLVLHMHLDLEIPKAKPVPATPTPAAPGTTPAP
jgi:uncharacterized protein DUF4157